MKEESATIPNWQRNVSRIVLIMDVAGLLLLLCCTTFVTPKFQQIFNDLFEGQPLPTLTRVVLSIPATAILLLCVAAVGALICKELRTSHPTRNLIINSTVLAAIFILFMVFFVAMFIPLDMIITSQKQ